MRKQIRIILQLRMGRSF